MRFREYLGVLQSASLEEQSHYVLGNSSADYDSIMGSLVMAFLLTATTHVLHVPVVDCLRPHLRLRFEVVAVLGKYKIEAERVFLFREQLLRRKQGWVVSLYDHNQRPQMDNAKIEYVIDHHALGECRGRKQLVTKMGSALTLLYYLMRHDALLRLQNQGTQSEKQKFVERVREFTYGQKFDKLSIKQPEVEAIIRMGIQIDCFNFDPAQAERWTLFDQQAVKQIQSLNTLELQTYEWINDLKHDRQLLESLSFEQAMVRDYKSEQYGKIHCEYSVIGLSPEQFHTRYQAQFQQFTVDTQKSNIFFIMALFRTQKGAPLKRAMMWRPKQLQSQLSERMSLYLQQDMTRQGSLGEWEWWSSTNNTLSRKKLHAGLKQLFTYNEKVSEEL